MARLQVQNITPNFSGSAQSMGQAIAGVNEVGSLARQALQDSENQRRYDKEQVRQKVLDDRATAQYEQQVADREGRIFVNKIAGETLPHLLSQDTATQGMEGILNQANTDRTTLLGQGGESTLAGVRTGGGTYQVPTETQRVVDGQRPNPEIPFNVKATQAGTKLPQPQQFEQYSPFEVGGASKGLRNAGVALSNLAQGDATDKLLDTPGMYNSVPGSSVRTLNQAGKAALAKGEIPGKTTLKSMSTQLDNIVLQDPLGKDGKPYTSGKAFFRDMQSGTLIPESVISKTLSGVDMKPQTVETVLGSKTVRVPGMQQATLASVRSGANPQQVQAVNQSITDGYNKVLSMLPKGNTARRDELRSVISALAADRGLDPKDFDVNKTLDSFLPKSEVSDIQKTAMNVVMKALDQNLEQINKNREFGLQERKFAADEAYKNAQLGLEQIKMSMQAKWHKDELASKADNQTVPMYKILPNGQHEIVKVPIGSAAQMEKAGYKPGTLGGSRTPIPSGGKDGKSGVDLMTLGGSQMLGGTSGIDLVTMSKRMKAQYPKVSQSAIDAEIANLSQGWLTDSVNEDKLHTALQGYQK